MDSPPQIYWLLQTNQVTEPMHQFFKVLQARMDQLLSISFIIPESSQDILARLEDLSPSVVRVHGRSAVTSYQGYLAKKQAIENTTFSEGLGLADALLLDDLGGGNVVQTSIDLKLPQGVCALVLQIPNALGSSESEERIFHAAILWARENRIPTIGYELLPLNMRWTLAASLPDAVVTKTKESFDHLKKIFGPNNLWQLPFYEAAIFSSLANTFTLNGIKSAYHHRSVHKIPEHRTIFYLPHNVAMIYEYQEVLRLLAPVGKELHLMFSYGKDQIRGAHTQQEMVEIIYSRELKQFASYSFHDMNAPWEMMLADSLISCSACYQTDIAEEKSIPSIIFDPMMPAGGNHLKQFVKTGTQLKQIVEGRIKDKKEKTELGTIFMQIARSMSHHG